MPAQKRIQCQICNTSDSKYTCAQCSIVYCSIPCYKTHKASSCRPQPTSHASKTDTTGLSVNNSLGQPSNQDEDKTTELSGQDAAPSDVDVLTHETSTPLRPLTSLKWPYVPEESAYPDPLKRDDPKPLQLYQYEAIATSPTIRRTLATHPQLPVLLHEIDVLRGPAREAALERALGVSPDSDAKAGRTGEDQRALRELAEAVEAAVRGGREGMLGLDWGNEAV